MPSDLASVLQRLPEGWYASDEKKAQGFLAELRKELPPGHLLFDKDVTVVAHRTGTDDILCRHINEPKRYTVIHLTWIMKQETDPQYPCVEVDGDFEDFLDYERSFLEANETE